MIRKTILIISALLVSGIAFAQSGNRNQSQTCPRNSTGQCLRAAKGGKVGPANGMRRGPGRGMRACRRGNL